jgi:hypothetical protein
MFHKLGKLVKGIKQKSTKIPEDRSKDQNPIPIVKTKRRISRDEAARIIQRKWRCYAGKISNHAVIQP